MSVINLARLRQDLSLKVELSYGGRNSATTVLRYLETIQQESGQYQLAMFKHAIGDDGLKVIETFSYTTEENVNDC